MDDNDPFLELANLPLDAKISDGGDHAEQTRDDANPFTPDLAS
jgi:hypothetical protein